MRRLTLVLLAVLLLGLADAVYLTSVAFGVPLACSSSGPFNCGGVIGSQFGKILGVPTAFYGLTWVVVSLIMLPSLGKRVAAQIWYFLGLAGVAYSLSSMAILREGCEYCLLLDAVIVVSVVLAFKVLQHAGDANQIA